MVFVTYKGKDGEVVTPSPEAVRKVQKMHSFDRRIKSEHMHKHPDLEENVPSYMRQTCASLIKRTTFKFRDLESLNLKCFRTKDEKAVRPSKKKSAYSKGTFTSPLTPQYNPLCVGEGTSRRARKGRSSESVGSSSPRSLYSRMDLSILSEQTEDDAISLAPSTLFSKASDDCYTDCSELLSFERKDGSLDHQELTKLEIQPAWSYLLSKSSGKVSANIAEVKDDSEETKNPEISLEVASFVQACFEKVIDDALALNNGQCTRGRSMDSVMTQIDSYSDVAADESFCVCIEELDRKVSLEDIAYESSLYKSSAVTSPVLEDMSSETEDAFGVMDEATFLEDEQGVESHRLNDILASYSDSEFGEDYTEKLLNCVTPTAERLSSESEFDISIPIRHLDLKRRNSLKRTESRELGRPDGQFKLTGPNLFWMLGGNVLAGVVGAAIVSGGNSLASEGRPADAEGDDAISTPRSDCARADDWFFQASSQRSQFE